MRKWILIALTILGSFLLLMDGARADKQTDIKIDGEFNDWQSISKSQVGYYHMGNWAVAVGNEDLWIYIDNGGNSDISIPTQNYTLTVGNKSYNLVFTGSDSQLTVTARDMNNSWQSLGDVGTGIIKKDGSKQNGEFTLSLSKLGASSSGSEKTTLANSNLGSQTVTGSSVQSSSDSASSSAGSSSSSSSSSSSTDSSSSSSVSDTSSESQSSVSSSSSQANPNNQSNDLGVVIDGSFNDWDDKTKSAMKITGDNDNIKNVSLLADDKDIYFYIEMHPVLSGGYVTFQPAGYELTVGNITYYLDFNGNSTVNLDEGQTKLVKLGIYNAKDNSYVTLNDQVGVTKKKISQKMGDGSTVEGEAYVLECAVPFSALKASSNTSGQTIALANRNLWTGQVNVTGGSTGPLILAGAGLLIAGFSVYKFGVFDNKSRRKKVK
ncbi:Firmicu-CTERM sorting domain-containing protein [Liquorilactobacillus uvarum]|uniref:Firmicu-CTERM sorting domain-containing protein n=1 Tax=Liquorilactobacillus uvarum DSM 19971 TaxID=1423812 RepID=A0A0R1PWA8_9LACO|nr:Firmicu-CTERM sorting domain-containing protein [Liquorilactobacillus uvarum]KRL36799.1 hypothetical protein FD20_GL001020 [Liquorilactobacillus uvarum DSM 19971]